MGVHWVGAFLILSGSVTIVVVGLFSGRLGASMWYRFLSVIVGACIFLRLPRSSPFRPSRRSSELEPWNESRCGEDSAGRPSSASR
jgi:hypothetical protein